jgi:hypothetical protein
MNEVRVESNVWCCLSYLLFSFYSIPCYKRLIQGECPIKQHFFQYCLIFLQLRSSLSLSYRSSVVCMIAWGEKREREHARMLASHLKCCARILLIVDDIPLFAFLSPHIVQSKSESIESYADSISRNTAKSIKVDFCITYHHKTKAILIKFCLNYTCCWFLIFILLWVTGHFSLEKNEKKGSVS